MSVTQEERLLALKDIRQNLITLGKQSNPSEIIETIRIVESQIITLIDAAKGEVTKPEAKTKTRVLIFGMDESYLHENCEDVMHRANNYLNINPDAKVFSQHSCINDNDGGFALTLVVEVPVDALPE